MATLRVSLDSSRCPTIAIAVSAPARASEFFDALIDTGFTGFVQLPVRRARELGLTPRAASEIEYADGRIDTIPLSWARVVLGVEAQEGFIHLQRESHEVIVGVEFLRLFQKTFVLSITPGLVLLMNDLADLTAQ
jgi:predicted aspartyl protease